jgi:hypothetical protein
VPPLYRHASSKLRALPKRHEVLGMARLEGKQCQRDLGKPP